MWCLRFEFWGFLPLVSREWKNGRNSSYTCTPFLHSLLTKGKFWGLRVRGLGFGVQALDLGFPVFFCLCLMCALSSSFLGLPYRILNMNHKTEILWGLRVLRFKS